MSPGTPAPASPDARRGPQGGDFRRYRTAGEDRRADTPMPSAWFNRCRDLPWAVGGRREVVSGQGGTHSGNARLLSARLATRMTAWATIASTAGASPAKSAVTATVVPKAT